MKSVKTIDRDQVINMLGEIDGVKQSLKQASVYENPELMRSMLLICVKKLEHAMNDLDDLFEYDTKTIFITK